MVFGGTRRRGLNNTSMSEDGSPFQSRGRKARREGGGILTHPRDEQSIRSVLEHDEQFGRARLNTMNTPSEGNLSSRLTHSAGHKAIKARGAELLRACVYYVVFRRCQGRENFSGRCPRNFSAQFLDKTSVGQEAVNRSAASVRAYALADAAIGWEDGAHS